MATKTAKRKTASKATRKGAAQAKTKTASKGKPKTLTLQKGHAVVLPKGAKTPPGKNQGFGVLATGDPARWGDRYTAVLRALAKLGATAAKPATSTQVANAAVGALVTQHTVRAIGYRAANPANTGGKPTVGVVVNPGAQRGYGFYLTPAGKAALKQSKSK